MGQANKLWIVRYSHRHGHDVWPVLSPEMPNEDEVIEGIEDWEGEEKDEYIEVYGPFANEPLKALQAVVESYDNTGCEDCGVIDASVYEGARKALGLSE